MMDDLLNETWIKQYFFEENFWLWRQEWEKLEVSAWKSLQIMITSHKTFDASISEEKGKFIER